MPPTLTRAAILALPDDQLGPAVAAALYPGRNGIAGTSPHPGDHFVTFAGMQKVLAAGKARQWEWRLTDGETTRAELVWVENVVSVHADDPAGWLPHAVARAFLLAHHAAEP